MDYNARFYGHSLGRFTQPDTIIPDPNNPQTLNRYSYVNNNPINYIDPTGHDEDCDKYSPYSPNSCVCQDKSPDNATDAAVCEIGVENFPRDARNNILIPRGITDVFLMQAWLELYKADRARAMYILENDTAIDFGTGDYVNRQVEMNCITFRRRLVPDICTFATVTRVDMDNRITINSAHNDGSPDSIAKAAAAMGGEVYHLEQNFSYVGAKDNSGNSVLEEYRQNQVSERIYYRLTGESLYGWTKIYHPYSESSLSQWREDIAAGLYGDLPLYPPNVYHYP